VTPAGFLAKVRGTKVNRLTLDLVADVERQASLNVWTRQKTRLRWTAILFFYMGEIPSERKDYVMENLVVTVEEWEDFATDFV